MKTEDTILFGGAADAMTACSMCCLKVPSKGTMTQKQTRHRINMLSGLLHDYGSEKKT